MSATFSPFFEVARTRPTSSTSRAHSMAKDSGRHPEELVLPGDEGSPARR